MSKTLIYRPEGNHAVTAVDLTRCRARVYAPRSFTRPYRQCDRKGVEAFTDPNDGTEYLFCKRHHPNAVAAAEAERAEKHRVRQAREVVVHLRWATDEQLQAELDRRAAARNVKGE